MEFCVRSYVYDIIIYYQSQPEYKERQFCGNVSTDSEN